MKSKFKFLLFTKPFIIFIFLIGLSFNHKAIAQNFEWAKSMGNGLKDDAGQSIVLDGAGNAYTTGYFEGDVDFDPGSGVFTLTSNQMDIFVTKFDNNGNFIWAKSIGGSGQDRGFSIAIDNASNIYITGVFYLTADFDPGIGIFNMTSVDNSDCFVLKLDSTGNFIWAKKFGGTGFDFSNSICIDNKGNILCTGRFENTVDFNPGSGVYNLQGTATSAFYLKLDDNGNFIWAKKTGASSGTLWTEGFSIAIDTAGNVYSTGHYSGNVDFDPGGGQVILNSSNEQVFILKLDSNGIFNWVRSIGGAFDDIGKSIKVDLMGNSYTTGYTTGIFDIDPGVNVHNLGSATTENVFILKLNTNGLYAWGSAVIDGRGNSLILDSIANVYTTGSFRDISDFDPSIDTFNVVGNSSGDDIFIYKLDSAGVFVWARGMGANGNSEIGYGITIDPIGNLYSTGEFNQTADFDPGPGVYNLNLSGISGHSDIYVHKMNQSILTSILEPQLQKDIVDLFPNPANDMLSMVSFNSKITNISMYNLTGQLIFKQKYNESTIHIPISDFKPGIYFTEITCEKGGTSTILKRKFIKN